ncbi:MAG: pilin [bacterium]|nr:pilin [bacterium]
MKHFLIALIFLQLVFLPAVVFAQPCTLPEVQSPEGGCYTPIPGVSPGVGTYTLMAPFGSLLSGSLDLTTYLQGAVQVIIGLAGILAVIMLVVCGIKLMGTPSASGKSEAKECIWNAIFGVLLAIGAWILLYTINPLLLSKELELAPVVVTSAPVTPTGPRVDPMPTSPGWYFRYSDATGTHNNPAGGSAAVCAELLDAAVKAGKTIVPLPDGRKCFSVDTPSTQIAQDEAAVRTALCGNTSCVGSTPVGINARPCNYVGDRGCTNVKGLPSSAVNFVRNLAASCNCTVIVSGGTEYWLHATHAENKPIFDLRIRQGDAATNYIIANGTGKRSSFTGYRVFLNGFWLTNEGDHWHACELGQSYWFCTNVITNRGAIVAP